MSKTKKFAAVLTAAVAACALVTAAGCCRHNHNSQFYAATCTEAGYYEDTCTKCGNVNERYETSPALGHEYEGGFCKRCGEPDPNDTTLSDEAGRLSLTSQGVLSWNKLKKATKYELTLTFPNEDEPKVYELPKNTGSLNLDEMFGKNNFNQPILFPAGRTFAKFVHYELYEEQIEGEKIEQEYPVVEDADEFRIIKRNGGFEMERMGYADENVTLTGFYADKKTDEKGDYYLYEFKLGEGNKPVKFNISKQVKPVSGAKAVYYKTASDRSSGNNAISSFDLPNYTYPAGASTMYMRLTLAGGGYKDYDLRLYGLKTLEVIRYSAGNDIRSEISKSTYLEGDIVPCEELFSGMPKYNKYIVRDGAYNYIGKAEWAFVGADGKYAGDADYTVRASGSGDTAEVYLYQSGNESQIKKLCEEYAKWSKIYGISEVWQPYSSGGEELAGYALNYLNSSETEAVLPAKINEKKILSADFSFAQITALNIEDVYTLPQLTLSYSAITTVNLGVIYEIGEGAFVGANGNLVINCAFGADHAASFFNAKWNYINPQNQYSTDKYTTNYNV